MRLKILAKFYLRQPYAGPLWYGSVFLYLQLFYFLLKPISFKICILSFLKNLSTRAYAKSCNSLEFYPIFAEIFRDDLLDTCLQDGVQNFLDFCRSCFINNFIVKSKFRNRRKNQKIKISWDPFIFKKFAHTALKILSAQISLKHFF